MTRRASPRLLAFSRELRHNQTEAEARLWQALRAHRFEDVHFRRQHAIGPYVADFCSPRKKLIIELDGSQHFEQEEYDAERTVYLEAKGFRLLRFWNNEVRDNPEGVLLTIVNVLEG